MKHTIIVILLFMTAAAEAQVIIVRHADSADRFSFRKVENNKVSSYNESYDILGKTSYDFMTAWDVSKEGVIYWTNGDNIYKCDWGRQKSTLVYAHLYWVLEFFIRGDFIYIVYNPSKQEGVGDNRYSGGLKFSRIDLRNYTKKDLKLPPGRNVSNLSISEDATWAVFVHTIGEEEPVFKLVLYNLKNGDQRIIDSADTGKSSWFGNVDMMNAASWTDATNLMYYKHFKNDDFGEILGYDVHTGHHNIWMGHFPQRDFTWFSINNGYLYCSSRHILYRTRDGINKETIYDAGKSNIINARVF